MTHTSSFVHPQAKIGTGVVIGPHCQIGPHVVLGDNVRLISNVIIEGRTHVGEGTVIYPYTLIGFPPQFRHGVEEVDGSIHIGRETVIREQVTIHLGSSKGNGLTKVGDHCLLMIGVHIGHDCDIGNHVELVNQVTLGGHCSVGDWAIIGGLSAAHQHVRIGQHVIVGGMSGIEGDVIPYGSAFGNRARLVGLNLVGLKRRGFSRDDINDLRHAYRLMFANEGNLTERVEDVEKMFSGHKPVMEIITFIRENEKRSLCLPNGS